MFTQAKQQLVFLPGFGFAKEIWRDVANHFSDHNCLLLDLPTLTHFDENTLSLIIEEIASKCEQQSVLIGWSLGGMIATALCHRYPDKFSQLVLVASAMDLSAETVQLIHEPQNQGFSAFWHSFQRLVCYPIRDKKIAEKLSATQQNWDDLRSLNAYLALLSNLNLQSNYQQITMPILHFYAEKDAIIPLKKQLELNKSNVNFHQIDRAGHAILLTHAAFISTKIREFLC